MDRAIVEPAGDGCSHIEPNLASNDVLRRIVRLGGDFIAVLQRGGEVVECSVSSDGFQGLGADDLLANGFLERIHITERPTLLGALSKAAHDGKESVLELRLRCPSNDNRPDQFCWIEMVCAPNERSASDDISDDTSNRQAQILCLVRDISRWKEREEQLVAQNNSVNELIESKTRFLNNIATANAINTNKVKRACCGSISFIPAGYKTVE